VATSFSAKLVYSGTHYAFSDIGPSFTTGHRGAALIAISFDPVQRPFLVLFCVIWKSVLVCL
jgi:hypothetical protein